MRPLDVGFSLKSFAVKNGPIFVIRPTHECGTRPFFRWVRSQGRNPHASGSSKNASGLVGTPYLGRLRRQAINLTIRWRVKTWGGGPLMPEVYPVQSHTRLNRSARHGQPKCDPDTEESPAVKSGPNICQCFPPDKAWHKFKSLKANKCGEKGRGTSGTS